MPNLCVHKEKIDSATHIGTCSICGQVKQYYPYSVELPVIIKEGRVPTVERIMPAAEVIPEPVIEEPVIEEKGNQGRKQTGETHRCADCGKEIYIRAYRLQEGKQYRCVTCSKKNFPPPPGKKKEVSKSETPSQVLDPRAKPPDWADMSASARSLFYDSKKDLILADLEKLGKQNEVAKLWDMGQSTLSYMLTTKWKVKEKTPRGSPKKTRFGKKRPLSYWKENLKQLTADYNSMDLKEFFRAWHLSSAAWIRLRDLLQIPKKSEAALTTRQEGKSIGENGGGLTTVKSVWLEEILKELEYLRGYKQAILDTSKKGR